MLGFYKKFRLSTYITIQITIWLFLLLMVGGFGLYSAMEIRNHYDILFHLYENYYLPAESIRLKHIILVNLIEKHVLSEDINMKNKYQAEIVKMKEKIDQEFDKLLKVQAFNEKYKDEMEYLINKRKKLREQIINLSEQGRENEALVLFKEEETKVFKKLDDMISIILEESDNIFTREYNLIESNYLKILIVFIVVFVSIIVFNLINVIYVHRGILDPIKNIVGIAGDVKSGNYSGRISEFKDKKYIKEMNELSEMINSMLSEIEKDKLKLHNMIENLSISNDKLKVRNTEMEEFVRTITHDLKSPLTTIEMFSEVLERDIVKNPKRAVNEIDRIRLSAKRLRNLINDLSEFSLIGIIKEKKGVTNPNVIIAEVLETLGFIKINEDAGGFEVFYMEKENSKVYLQEKIPKIYADNTRVSQLFMNLVSNAIKYKSENPPVVYIEGFSEGDFTHITVKDNGMGILSDYKNKIFDICFRLVSQDKVEGAGVGLSIVKKIVENYSGKIWVESEGEGKGSVFHVILPSIENVKS